MASVHLMASTAVVALACSEVGRVGVLRARLARSLVRGELGDGAQHTGSAGAVGLATATAVVAALGTSGGSNLARGAVNANIVAWRECSSTAKDAAVLGTVGLGTGSTDLA